MNRARRFLMLMMLMLLFTLTAKAQEAARLSFDTTIRSSDNYVDVSVNLSGNSGFAAYQMDIFYDSEYLQPLAVTGGLGGTPAYNMNAVSGQRTCVKIAQAEVMPIQGDGELFDIRFQILNVPKGGFSTTLQAENVRIYAGDGTAFALRIENANIVLPSNASEDENTSADTSNSSLQEETVPPEPIQGDENKTPSPSGPGEDAESTDDHPSVSETDTSAPQHDGSDTDTLDPDNSVAGDVADNGSDASGADAEQSDQAGVSERPESDLATGLAENEKAGKNSIFWIIFIAVVLLAAAGGAAGFFLYRRHKTKEIPRGRE